MTLPKATKPEFLRKVTQKTWGAGGHTYVIQDYPCGRCAACSGTDKRYKEPRPDKCTGMGGISTIAGTLKNSGGLYNAGRNSVLNALFGDPNDDDDTGLYKAHIPAETLRVIAAKAPSKGSISRQYGTDVHAAIEAWLKHSMGLGPEPMFSPELYKPAHQVVEWLDKHEWTVLDAEPTVYHPSGAFAGTADCIAKRGATTAIFDWKTGGDIYPESALQVAGYAVAYESITGEKVQEGYVIRSNATVLEVAQVENFEHAQFLFREIVKLRAQATSEYADGMRFRYL